MSQLIKNYFRQQDGATAIEYGLIAAAIGLAITATVGLIGADINGFFVTMRTFL